MKVNIYELIDPRSNLPRYIGRTAGNIKTRLSNHLTEAKVNTSNSHRINWINELLKLNLKPIVNLIAVVDTEEWDVWEIFYIQLYKDLGYSLVNGSIGGDGFAPGSIPCSIAARVACNASSTLSFFSFISTSLLPPTLIIETPPINLAIRSCNFSLS
jgi:hypothetical protein